MTPKKKNKKFIKMAISIRILLICLCGILLINVTYSTTREMLECRENLTASIKNDTIFLSKIQQADYIFTGKIKEHEKNMLHVRVKRAIKGNLNDTMNLVLNDTCGSYVRRSFTGIFMGKRDYGFDNQIIMHFGPVPLTLANLDRLNAAVQG